MLVNMIAANRLYCVVVYHKIENRPYENLYLYNYDILVKIKQTFTGIPHDNQQKKASDAFLFMKKYRTLS